MTAVIAQKPGSFLEFDNMILRGFATRHLLSRAPPLNYTIPNSGLWPSVVAEPGATVISCPTSPHPLSFYSLSIIPVQCVSCTVFIRLLHLLLPLVSEAVRVLQLRSINVSSFFLDDNCDSWNQDPAASPIGIFLTNGANLQNNVIAALNVGLRSIDVPILDVNGAVGEPPLPSSNSELMANNWVGLMNCHPMKSILKRNMVYSPSAQQLDQMHLQLTDSLRREGEYMFTRWATGLQLTMMPCCAQA